MKKINIKLIEFSVNKPTEKMNGIINISIDLWEIIAILLIICVVVKKCWC